MYKALNSLGFICFSNILHTRTFFDCPKKCRYVFRRMRYFASVDAAYSPRGKSTCWRVAAISDRNRKASSSVAHAYGRGVGT